jgi:hypothetical protein
MVKVETNDPYAIGTTYRMLPIPMVPEHCIALDAGPVQLVVEARQLTNEIVEESLPPEYRAVRDRGAAAQLDDFGASLHVVGTDDGREHLRFDCFEHSPHYHYVRHSDATQVVVAIDFHAEADATAWTLTRLRTRLPEMLEFAGVPALADEVRAASDTVLAAVDDVEELFSQAQVQAVADRAARA